MAFGGPFDPAVFQPNVFQPFREERALRWCPECKKVEVIDKHSPKCDCGVARYRGTR